MSRLKRRGKKAATPRCTFVNTVQGFRLNIPLADKALYLIDFLGWFSNKIFFLISSLVHESNENKIFQKKRRGILRDVVPPTAGESGVMVKVSFSHCRNSKTLMWLLSGFFISWKGMFGCRKSKWLDKKFWKEVFWIPYRKRDTLNFLL